MIKFKLLNKARGVGKESGKPWYRITLAADHGDGTRAVTDFFVSSEIAEKIDPIPLDASVFISAALDEYLRFSIIDVRPADKS